MRKRKIIKQINSFHLYLLKRKNELRERQYTGERNIGQFHATKIITGFFEDEFDKVLKEDK